MCPTAAVTTAPRWCLQRYSKSRPQRVALGGERAADHLGRHRSIGEAGRLCSSHEQTVRLVQF